MHNKANASRSISTRALVVGVVEATAGAAEEIAGEAAVHIMGVAASGGSSACPGLGEVGCQKGTAFSRP